MEEVLFPVQSGEASRRARPDWTGAAELVKPRSPSPAIISYPARAWRLGLVRYRLRESAPFATLKVRLEGETSPRFDGVIVACTPRDIVQEELECDRSGGVGDDDNPSVVRDTFHREPLVPAQPRAFAAEVKTVSKPGINLSPNCGASRFGHRLWFGFAKVGFRIGRRSFRHGIPR